MSRLTVEMQPLTCENVVSERIGAHERRPNESVGHATHNPKVILGTIYLSRRRKDVAVEELGTQDSQA